MIVWANLDCEARWAGITLPRHVQQRISAAAAVLAAFAPDGERVEIYAPAAVEPERVNLPNVTMRAGTPDRYDLAWADPAAKAANDRRLALALHERRGTSLPGQRVITSLDDLRDASGPWVCKAPWTAAGRDRAHGGGPPSGELAVYVGRLLERFGALLYEPWCDRILDVGVCGRIDERGTVTAHAPHTLLSDPRGGFLGIDLAQPPLLADERAELGRVIEDAGRALHAVGYAGPFSVDAFVYREPPEPGSAFLVLREDIYETKYGDGYYAYLAATFADRATAETWITETERIEAHQRTPNNTPNNTTSYAYHLREATLLRTTTGWQLAADLRTGEHATLDEVLAALAPRKLHAPCEINARHTFGHVTHALAARFGARVLGFAQPPPPDARVLVDGAAWITS